MTARLIIAERSGFWAAALRIELQETGVRLWEAGPRPALPDLLAESPASFLILELTAGNAAWTVDALEQLEFRWPDVRAAIVAHRNLAEYEWLLREAGAMHFLTSPRRLAPLVDLACRHLAAAPTPKQTLSDRIWATLPWGETR